MERVGGSTPRQMAVAFLWIAIAFIFSTTVGHYMGATSRPVISSDVAAQLPPNVIEVHERDPVLAVVD